MGNKLQINWVYLVCTAGAPVCFHAVSISCERDYIVKREYMNKGDRTIPCFNTRRLVLKKTVFLRGRVR